MSEPTPRVFTPEQLQTQAAFAAWQLGEPIQFKSVIEDEDRFRPCGAISPDFTNKRINFRPAPKPALPRPWSAPEHVPLNCWIKFDGEMLLVVAIYPDGIRASGVRFMWGELTASKHSTDRINWRPCTVTQPAP